jgi:hypothetical protein
MSELSNGTKKHTSKSRETIPLRAKKLGKKNERWVKILVTQSPVNIETINIIQYIGMNSTQLNNARAQVNTIESLE